VASHLNNTSIFDGRGKIPMHRVRAVRDMKDRFASPKCDDELRCVGDNLGRTMSRMRKQMMSLLMVLG